MKIINLKTSLVFGLFLLAILVAPTAFADVSVTGPATIEVNGTRVNVAADGTLTAATAGETVPSLDGASVTIVTGTATFSTTGTSSVKINNIVGYYLAQNGDSVRAQSSRGGRSLSLTVLSGSLDYIRKGVFSGTRTGQVGTGNAKAVTTEPLKNGNVPGGLGTNIGTQDGAVGGNEQAASMTSP